MADEEKRIEEEIVDVTNTPSDEIVEETDATTELPDVTEVDDKPEEVEETTGDGGESADTDGADGDSSTEESTEELDSEDSTKLDTEKQKDLSAQEGIKETDEKVEEVAPTPDIDIETLRAEIEDLKYEKETNDAIAEFQNIVAKQQSEYEAFTTELQSKVVEEFNKYGIPMDMDVNELKATDPAKYQIMTNILTNAQNVHDKVTAEIQNPIKEASDNIVFRIAGKEMKKYDLTLEQAQEAAKTFVNIMHEVGVKDLKDDLIGKVELAVARGKLIVGDVKKTIEDTKEAVKETIKDAKDTADKIGDVVDTVKEKVETPVKKEGKKLEDFTKGANPGLPPKGAEVNKENVMELYLSQPEGERLKFFAAHKDLIMEQLKHTGMGYSDKARRW